MARAIGCLVLGVALLAIGSFACTESEAPARPNVLIVVADDLGWGDIGYHGSEIRTPRIDRLASESVRLERFYAQPLCTPTRAQLMTGKYNVRNYTRFGHLDPAQTTFGQLFQQAGYATCMAGKWQLGRDMKLPARFGL